MDFHFENQVLDLSRRELRRDGERIAVEPQVFDLMVYLVESRDRVVSKDELFERIWKGRIVSESALTSRINAARKALGDSGETQRLIRTVQRKGFRFVGEVRTAAMPPAQPVPKAPASLDRPSIAVLPFTNMSGDPEQEYFADGMVEDIITALSRFKSLFVIARNSSFTYKGKAVDIKQVGRELGVRYVLEGSVRKAGGRLRITGQLLDSDTGAHLWADRFDGSLEDVFVLQDRITASVVAAIAPRIDQAEIARARRKPVESLDAYDLFLRGLAGIQDTAIASREEALRLFYRAIELAPNFATPYAMAARCYVSRKQEGGVVDRDWEEAEARRLAKQVQIIGRDDALALCLAGHAIAFVCREYETGAAMIDQGLTLNPNLAIGWQTRGIVSIYAGDYAAGIEQLGQVLRLNPLDPERYRSETFIGYAHLLQGEYGEALKWANKALARQPNSTAAMRVSAAANAQAGNLPEARKTAAAMLQLAPTLSLSYLKSIAPFRPGDVERVLEGLRLAGIPE